MEINNYFKKDLKQIEDPVKCQDDCLHDVCVFRCVDVDLDVSELNHEAVMSLCYTVIERGKHAYASLEYLEKKSICYVEGQEIILEYYYDLGNVCKKRGVIANAGYARNPRNKETLTARSKTHSRRKGRKGRQEDFFICRVYGK